MKWLTRIFGRSSEPAHPEASLGARGFQCDHVYHELPCLDRAGELLPGNLGWTFGDDTHVTYRIFPLERDFFATGFDVWEAFSELRRQLERAGFLIQCAGARKEVRPSGMARNMGDGTTAYVHTLGESPDPESDLVYLFESCAAGEGVTLKEQSKFYEQWRDSLEDL